MRDTTTTTDTDNEGTYQKEDTREDDNREGGQ